MPFTLMQVSDKLKTVNTDGGLSPALILPPGVTLATNRTPRFAKFKRYCILVNTPTQPLSIDVNGIVRPLTIPAPTGPVTLSNGAAGTLSGTYRALQTYKILDALGNIITESDYGPAMINAFTIVNRRLHADFPLSPTPVDASQIYRTLTNGGVYFSWGQVDGSTSSLENDLSDEAIGLIAAPELGPAPDLTLICEWAGRLWGVDRQKIDDLRYTSAGTMYGWSALNVLPIMHVGSDGAGITALIPRRAALGVTRRDMFLQVTGSQRTNFQPVVVNGGEQVGCVSQESVVVFNDVAYFLFRDGVYRWDSNGITCLTNGSVRTWFTSDDVFNRSMFWRAFGCMSPDGLKYRLFLASTGQDHTDRWIELDLLTGAWFGPHKTDAFTPSSAFLVAGRNQQPYFMIGSQEGYLSQDSPNIKNDWGVMPIVLQVRTKGHDMNEPDYDKYWGEFSILGEAQPAGTLTITPTVGELDGEGIVQPPFDYDMTQSRQRLFRIGNGKQATLQFDQGTINQDVVLFGYEINPVRIIGRR